MSPMSLPEQISTIAICIFGTMLTRFLPFLIFSSKKPTPKMVQYLGKALPCAVFGLLVVYCLKHVSVFSGSHGIPEFIAIAVTAALHLWKKANAALHCRRHGRLYALTAACFLA